MFRGFPDRQRQSGWDTQQTPFLYYKSVLVPRLFPVLHSQHALCSSSGNPNYSSFLEVKTLHTTLPTSSAQRPRLKYSHHTRPVGNIQQCLQHHGKTEQYHTSTTSTTQRHKRILYLALIWQDLFLLINVMVYYTQHRKHTRYFPEALNHSITVLCSAFYNVPGLQDTK